MLTPGIDMVNEFAGSWDHALFLTYTHDLLFFERQLLRRLRGSGCNNICLFVDEVTHFGTIASQSGVRALGKEYVVQTFRPAKVYHPKIYLLVNAEQCKLLIGSGNLTIPGFYTNKEMFSVYTYPLDALQETIIADVLQFLRELIDMGNIRREVLIAIVNMLKAIPDVQTRNASEHGLEDGMLLHNLKSTLIKQAKSVIDEQISELVVLSPYFDTDCRIFTTICKLFKVKKITIITQSGYSNLDIDAAKSKATQCGIELSLKRLAFENKKNNRNHAKFFAFRGGRSDFILWGSPNFSSAALNSTYESGNLETAVIQRVPSNFWQDAILSPDLKITDLDEATFISTPSLGYAMESSPSLLLIDATLTADKLELAVKGERLSEKMFVKFGTEARVEVSAKIEYQEEFDVTHFYFLKECCPALPIYAQLELLIGDDVVATNPIWVNGELELETARLNPEAISRRNAFTNPDFKSADHWLKVLEYIFNELQLEQKNLPAILSRVSAPLPESAADDSELSFYIEEDPTSYPEWVIRPYNQESLELYGQFIHAIYRDLGIGHSHQGISKSDGHSPIAVDLNSQQGSNIRSRFKSFIHAYMHGISDEVYMSRVPIATVLTNYNIITKSFFLIGEIQDRHGVRLIALSDIKREYRALHKELLRSLPNLLIKQDDRDYFVQHILPVMLADYLTDYWEMNLSGDGHRAASCRGMLEKIIQSIDNKIIKIRSIVDCNFAVTVIEYAKLFGLGKKEDEVKTCEFILECLGSITLAEGLTKLKNLNGVVSILYTIDPFPKIAIKSNTDGEPQNWIALTAIYFMLITEDWKEHHKFCLSITNLSSNKPKEKIIFLYDKHRKELITCDVFRKGYRFYWHKQNVDESMIKGDYRNTITDVLKGGKEVSRPDSDLKTLIDRMK